MRVNVRAMDRAFTAAHRGGCGSPLVCLHGLTDTWRTWQLVLPALERHHDVLALTLAGHAGGPALDGQVTDAVLADGVERAMDEAGFETASIVGNSLGGYVALQLAMRDRAQTVVALGLPALLDLAERVGWSLDPERIACPVRIVWGTADRILTWPSAAIRYRTAWLPHADWIELDDVGHLPQLDVPLVTAELILGFTAR